MSYCDQHLASQFLPLVVEVFGCLHKHVDMFLRNCAKAIRSLEGPKGPPSFVLVISAKKFNHITKVTSILHLKLSGGRRPTYFLTSTPLGHIFHLYGRLIASGQFLKWTNIADLLQSN